MIIDEVLPYYQSNDISTQEIHDNIQSLLDRCDLAKIVYVAELEIFEEKLKYLVVKFPAGRECVDYHCFEYKNITSLLSIKFEKYHFLINYNSVFSYENDTIECLITCVNVPSFRNICARLQDLRLSEIEDEHLDNISINVESSNKKISLSKPSKELEILIPSGSRRSLAISIKGSNIKKYDDVIHNLEVIGNSFFFQIDLCKNVSFLLQKTRRRNSISLIAKVKNTTSTIDFPSYEYDNAPLSLYWYGKSANHMPLLQYLSFYQAIEYYFPSYFNEEIKKKFQTVLKDPSFRLDKNSDISKLLNIAKYNNGGYGSEKEMLKVTIDACIDEVELRKILSANEDIIKHFSTKLKGISDCTIPIQNEKNDIRNSIAERIYDIRCKIVHTKNDNDDIFGSFLLPFSSESEMLNLDIDLVQLIAQKVIISSSTLLKI